MSQLFGFLLRFVLVSGGLMVLSFIVWCLWCAKLRREYG